MSDDQYRRQGRASRDELLAKLAEMEDHNAGRVNEAPGLSEAEQMARDAVPPKRRVDGGLVGSPRHRNLTSAQMEFAKGLIAGKTQLEAYRDAYPNARTTDRVLKANAWKLSQDIRIQRMMQEHWGETVEALTEDAVAVKRYVIKNLLELSKNAKQEGSKLKALELMGKSVGLFKAQEEQEDRSITADQLKLDLARHLKLIRNVRPVAINAMQITAPPAEEMMIVPEGAGLNTRAMPVDGDV
jgi:hypothetical protein